MTKIETAVVLAGGEGLRLRPLTQKQPKAMTKVLGKPVLQWIIEWLHHNKIKHVVLGIAYCRNLIIDYFGDGSGFEVEIDYSVHTIPGGTGEGFRLAIERFVDDQTFLAMNGDEITNFNLKDMANYHFKNDYMGTIAVTEFHSPYGVVKTGRDGEVLAFAEKPVIPSMLINVGIYLFHKNIINYLPKQGPIETTTFPLLTEYGSLGSFKFNGTWLTIDTLKDLKTAEDTLKKKVEAGKWLK